MEECEAGGPWHSATQSHLLGLCLQRLGGLSVSPPDPRPQGWERGAESPAVWAASLVPCPLAQQHQGSEDSPQPEGGSTCLPHLQPKARSCKGIRGAPGGMNKQRHACLSVSFLLSDTHCSATWKLFQIQHIQTFLLFTRCIVIHRMIKP